jgi:hypothetical protein
MNSLLSALLILAAPLSWTDLQPGEKLQLTEKITIGENGPSFPAGTALHYESAEPLDIAGYPVLFLKLKEIQCAHPEWNHEMEILVPKGNPESSSVGVELKPGCNWGIYVEQKDLFQPSFFTRSEIN